MGSVWKCSIGDLPEDDDLDLPQGADSPMREAVRLAYITLTGKEPKAIFSGWGEGFTEIEAEVARCSSDRKPF